MEWSRTDKDDSNGETQDFCACIYDIWETIYLDGEQSIPHIRMLNTLLEHLEGRVLDYMEERQGRICCNDQRLERNTGEI